MTRRPFAPSRRPRLAIAALLLGCSASSFALNAATIVASTLSPDCLEYRVTGICYWLNCTWTGCTVRTSAKVRHYIPDAVVSSYSNTGENPWIEVRAMSLPSPTAKAGGDGTTNEGHETTWRSSRTPTSSAIPVAMCSASSPAPPGLRKSRRLHGYPLAAPSALFAEVPPDNRYLSLTRS